MPVGLVTGSGRRLGKQIALAMAGSGFDVAINYNQSKLSAENVVGEIEKIGRKSIAIQTDIRKSKAVQSMFEEVLDVFGRLDVLVNNSAIFPDSSFPVLTEEIWDDVIDTNLKGVFLCSKSAGEIMLRQKSGHVINIASLGGIQAWEKHIPYSVSKAGVIMLTKCLAKAFAPDVFVNAIAPGTIINPEEEEHYIKHLPQSRIPMKKYGKPSDVCNIILFLVNTSE